MFALPVVHAGSISSVIMPSNLCTKKIGGGHEKMQCLFLIDPLHGLEYFLHVQGKYRMKKCSFPVTFDGYQPCDVTALHFTLRSSRDIESSQA